MSEKAVGIGQYFVTSGAHVIFQDLPVSGSKKFSKFILEGLKEEVWRLLGAWKMIPSSMPAR